MATPWDWSPYLIGGALRPDAVSGLAPDFNTALQGLFASAPPEILDSLRMTSGYRSPEVQAGLWEDALAKYGSPEAARKWVAPPGNSYHNRGSAVDLSFLSPAARQWAHDNAARFGLTFPLANEPWHIEPAGQRGGVMAGVTGQIPAQPAGGVMGAVMGGQQTPDKPPETLKLFGKDTGIGMDKVDALAGLFDGSKQDDTPMQVPTIQTGPGYVKRDDSLSKALAAFQQMQTKRRIG